LYNRYITNSENIFATANSFFENLVFCSKKKQILNNILLPTNENLGRFVTNQWKHWLFCYQPLENLVVLLPTNGNIGCFVTNQ